MDFKSWTAEILYPTYRCSRGRLKASDLAWIWQKFQRFRASPITPISLRDFTTNFTTQVGKFGGGKWKTADLIDDRLDSGPDSKIEHKENECRGSDGGGLTKLDGRDATKLKLTEKEAWAMWREGFRFSIFDPESDEYRLSVPYSVARERGTLAISQH